MTVRHFPTTVEDILNDQYGAEISESLSENDDTPNDKPWPCPHADEYECNKKFKRKTHAVRHGRTHREEWPCTICDSVFTRSDHLMSHFDGLHPEGEKWKLKSRPTTPKNQDRPPPSSKPGSRFPCPHAENFDCGKSFQRRDHAERHGKTHVKEFSCPFAVRYACMKSFSREDLAKRHGKTHVEEWPCPLCEKAIDRRDNLVLHMKDYHHTDNIPNLRPRSKVLKQRTTRIDTTSNAHLSVQEQATTITDATAILYEANTSEDVSEVDTNPGAGGTKETVQPSRAHKQPTVQEEVDDGIMTNDQIQPMPIVEPLSAEENPGKVGLRPALKRRLSSSSTLIPADISSLFDCQPKKRVRFSSPLDDATTPSSPPSLTSDSELYLSSPPPVWRPPPAPPLIRNATFYFSAKHGCCALIRRKDVHYSVNEQGDLMVNGYKRRRTKVLAGFIARVSRWDNGDKDTESYCAQLLLRGLPTTTNKEVAKWRLYENRMASSMSEEQDLQLTRLERVQLKLRLALDTVLPGLKDGTRSPDYEEPEWKQYNAAQSGKWMIEESASIVERGKEYHAVMRCWVSVRSPLPKPPKAAAEDDNILQQAILAGHGIRALHPHGRHDDNNNAEHPPNPSRATKPTMLSDPTICFKCYSPFPLCTCSVCARCDQPVNMAYRVKCHCFCKDCERPIAEAHGVERGSAPPGYYCRCMVDGDIKKYYDEKCGREDVFVVGEGDYDELERIMKEFEEEQEQQEKLRPQSAEAVEADEQKVQSDSQCDGATVAMPSSCSTSRQEPFKNVKQPTRIQQVDGADDSDDYCGDSLEQASISSSQGSRRSKRCATFRQPHQQRRGRKRGSRTKRKQKQYHADVADVDKTKIQQDHEIEGQSRLKEGIQTRMSVWVARHAPQMFAPPRNATAGGSQMLDLFDLCGRYELIMTSSNGDVRDHNATFDLMLASNGEQLYGYFRLGDELHGLLRIPTIPTASSTDGVRLDVIIEDPFTKDGSWLLPAADKGGKVPGATMFLGGQPGLAVLFHPLLGDQVHFANKVGEAKQAGTALGQGLSESWRAICERFGGAECTLLADEGRSAGIQEVMWDEELVDELVDALREPEVA